MLDPTSPPNSTRSSGSGQVPDGVPATPPRATPSLTASLLASAVLAATAAGHELVRRWGEVRGLDSKSSPTDPVSDADRAAEHVIDRHLAAARPDDGRIGEEGTRMGRRADRSDIDWTFDPLDGTVNYLYGSDDWCVSVAAADRHGTLVGVVHQPRPGRTFWAVRGEGAFRDGIPLRRNDAAATGTGDLLTGALVGTGFSYLSDVRQDQATVVAGLVPLVRDIRRSGSAALDLCRVADGVTDAYYETPINSWDIAAATLIAGEAGAVCRVDDLGRESRAVVAAPPAIIDTLVRALCETQPGRAAFTFASRTGGGPA